MNKDTEFQLKHSIFDMQALSSVLNLSEEEKIVVSKKLRLTPYVLSLIKQNNSKAIRKQFIPSVNTTNNEFPDDYLKESTYTPVENLVHRYKNKAIYIATNQCACYCQFCTRQRIMQNNTPYHENLDEVINYLKIHTEINDLLITGGDPLMLDTPKLVKIIDEVASIQHISIIRIGTRVPITLPMRIDTDLLQALKQYPNLYINIHINHVLELTDLSKKAILSLANIGIPLGSQTVLLKDINDNFETLKELFETLLTIKVKPYYLYQCDMVRGCEEFVSSVSEGIKIINSFCNVLSGFAIPKFVVDTPEVGKIILAPCSSISESNNILAQSSTCEMFIQTYIT